MDRFASCPLLALLLVLATLAGTASAQTTRRVAIGRFSGPQGSSSRSALVTNLTNNGFEVVEWNQVLETARAELGRTRLRDDDDYVTVAQALNLNAFVTGRVSRSRRSWSLRVTVRNGADGQRLGSASWSGRTVASLRSIRNNGTDRLEQYFALAHRPAAPIAPPPPQPDPVVDDGSTPWYAGDEPIPEDGEDPEEQEDPITEARTQDGIRFALELGTLRRTMRTEVLVDSALRAPFTGGSLITEKREFASRGVGHFEAGFSAEIFPGALMDDPVVPWLGLRIRFRNSIGLQSSGFGCRVLDEPEPPGMSPRPRGGRCPEDPDAIVPISTTQREIYIGARVDYDFGEEGRGPYFLLDVGYGLFQFILEPEDLRRVDRNSIIPPIEYSFINLSGGVRYYFSDAVGVEVRGAYRVGLGVGTAALNIWGTETSDMSGYGFGADILGRLDALARGLYFSVGVEYFKFTTTFAGQTACAATDGSDACDPDELWEPWPMGGGLLQPVGDSYLRLNLSIGYAFR